MESSKNSILKTLLYYDIFNYPLTKKEIWQLLVTDKKIEKSEFNRAFTNKNFSSYRSFYFLNKGREKVKERLNKEKISARKLEKALRIIKKISVIPSVQFIGISGSLSMKNSKPKDDIDIFVISEKRLIWTTRLLLVAVLTLLGVYRNKKNKKYKDKICLNLIIGNNNMGFDKSRHNLYIAHEIVQLIPVFQRDNTYHSFIGKNSWISSLLPNYREKISGNKIFITKEKNIAAQFLIRAMHLFRIERFAKIAQFAYMKNDITKEIIKDEFLAFHPRDYQKYVIQNLTAAYKKHKLETAGIDTRGH